MWPFLVVVTPNALIGAPELDPVERGWAYLRANTLTHRPWNSDNAHRGSLLQRLEHADEHAKALGLHHPSNLGQKRQPTWRLI